MEESIKLISLALLGVAAGFLNVTAGGGSLLTLPFLIFLGLPATVANGTNRIAILIQNLFATARFHQFKVIPKESAWVTIVPAVVGALLGAQIAVNIDQTLFKKILAIVMVLVLALMFFSHSDRGSQTVPQMGRAKKIILSVVFFVIGIYGGFIQAGIGFLIIAALTAVGYDLVRTNALKVLVILIFTPLALFIFILHGEVDYVKGFVLAAGNASGAWIATRVVVEKGHKFIKWIVMIAVVAFAAKLLIE